PFLGEGFGETLKVVEGVMVLDKHRSSSWCNPETRSILPNRHNPRNRSARYFRTWYYAVHFDVTDGNLTDGQDVKLVVAHVNQPPQMVPVPAQMTQEGLTLAFTIAAGDPDGDPLSYFVSGSLPKGATFDPTTQLFSWTPDFGQAGVYTVHFGAMD